MRVRIAPIRAAGLGFLVLLNLWLLATLLWETISDSVISVENIEWTPKLLVTGEDAGVDKPISFYKEALARPIFSKTRRPYVPPPPARPEPSPAPIAAPPITDPGILVGGVIIERGLKKAFLFSKSDPQGSWVKEGETFLGWRLHSVESAGVKLQQQNRILEVLLYPKAG
jgi:hypothetical protein